MKDTLLVAARYCGPVASGNGGYVSGALAHELGDTLGRAVTVTLRQPPPLDATMHVNPVEQGLTLTFGGDGLAQQLNLTDRETVVEMRGSSARLTPT